MHYDYTVYLNTGTEIEFNYQGELQTIDCQITPVPQGIIPKMIAEYAGHTECDVQPCHSDEFPSPVKRPAYSVLDKTKIKQTFDVKVPYWTESLKVCMENMK